MVEGAGWRQTLWLLEDVAKLGKRQWEDVVDGGRTRLGGVGRLHAKPVDAVVDAPEGHGERVEVPYDGAQGATSVAMK